MYRPIRFYFSSCWARFSSSHKNTSTNQHKYHLFLIIGGLVLFATPLWAAEPQPPPNKEAASSNSSRSPLDGIRLIERKQIHIDWHFWRGFRLVRQEKKLETGFLFGNYRELFLGSSRATRLAQKAHNLQIMGLTFGLIGGAAMLGPPIALYIVNQFVVATGSLLLVAITATIGFAVTITGALLSILGRGLLLRAVRYYNEDLLSHVRKHYITSHQPRSPQATPGRLLSFHF